MTEKYFGITDTGRMRDNNEDSFIAEKVLKGRYTMACVIDGVGGYEGGEVAAHITRETILHYFSIPSGEIVTMMKEALTVANEKIAEEKKNGGHENMACVVTMAITDTDNKKFYYAHIGDTRLYLFRDHSLVKITKDHSFVGFLEDSGRLSEEEAMNHPKRNEINKALGFNVQIKADEEFIETGESPFLPGDVLLLCSDGLSDMVNNAAITSILSNNNSIEEKGNELIEAANSAGGKDNITAVLVQNTGKPLKQKATKPAAIKKNEQQEKEELVNENKHTSFEETKMPRRRSRGVIRFLTICCGLLLGALAWSFFRWRPLSEKENPALISQQNPQEKKLLDTLNLFTTTTLLVSDSLVSSPLYLTDTLLIQKDSLYILGNENFVIKADPGFKGPGILLAPGCQYILLENIVFENFDVAILAQNKSLHLKNVQFKNCRVPVQYEFAFPDNNYVNGDFSDSAFFKSDSLPHQVK
jgi:serine/threonine protein phosphatase PrpC